MTFDDIEEMLGNRASGFGSVCVEVTIGTTRWLTSFFPDSERATYVLPLTRAVRVAERLTPGSRTVVDLVVVQ